MSVCAMDSQSAMDLEDADPGRYEYICETYTWTGVCANGVNCSRYHSPDRLPYLWLVGEDGQLRKSHDTVVFEKMFCEPGDFISKLPDDFSDFSAISAPVESTGINHSVTLKRLSTPSYVDAAPGTPLNFYTQWMWYWQELDGTYTPFYPGTLQYTLEEKYLRGQQKYYFEFENLHLMVDTQSFKQTNQETKLSTKLLRRPVYVPSDKSKVPEMSPLLLPDVATHVHPVPDNWSAVDRFQDFELVELDSDNLDYSALQQQFFLTMDVNRHKIVHIFRVQNPALWDKYCSARRAMIPKDQIQKDVDERHLFHGTPTLQAARGICANSFDFRRSGENVGAVYGKGAYFSTSAKYSHKYTRARTPVTGDPLRFMFVGRILVGQYTLGDHSYTKPPERDGLKLYDSCVNSLSSPTIFVIFDLTQSYPEYLVQYTDVSDRRQEAKGQHLQQLANLQQVIPPIDSSAYSSARLSRYPLRSGKSSDTISALVSSLLHISTTSTAASTTSTATSTSSSRVSVSGLSTASQAVSQSPSEQSHTLLGISTSATTQAVSRPSAVSIATKTSNKESLSSAVQSLARTAMHQQSHSANQPCTSALTQPVSRSVTVQPHQHSPLPQRILRAATRQPVSRPPAVSIATAQPVIPSANNPPVSSLLSVNTRSEENCEEDMEWL